MFKRTACETHTAVFNIAFRRLKAADFLFGSREVSTTAACYHRTPDAREAYYHKRYHTQTQRRPSPALQFQTPSDCHENIVHVTSLGVVWHAGMLGY